MRMTEVEYPNATPIDSYGPGLFRIDGQVWNDGVAILPQAISRWGGLGDWDAILAAAADYDVLFVGTGAEISPIPTADRAILDAADIAYEPMATPAACRTYNVLLSEGRRVAAVLTPV